MGILVRAKSGIVKFRNVDGCDVDNFIAAIKAHDKIVTAEKDRKVKAFDIPNDPMFGLQYGLQKINAPDAWDIHTGGDGGDDDVVIAVIDTGVDYTHPDLKNNMWVNSGEIPNNDIDDDG